jgi:hypothetical protein
MKCAECGYSLEGLQNDGKCPECGLAIALSLTEHLGPRGRSLWRVLKVCFWGAAVIMAAGICINARVSGPFAGPSVAAVAAKSMVLFGGLTLGLVFAAGVIWDLSVEQRRHPLMLTFLWMGCLFALALSACLMPMLEHPRNSWFGG